MPHKVHVDSLPFELLVNVFQLLGQKDLCRCCRVMKRWNLILYDSPTLWKTLVLSNQLSLGGDKQFNAVSSPSNSSGRGRAPPPVSNIPSLSDTSTTSATAVIATSSDANYFEKSDSRIYIDGGHFPILNEGANQRLFQLLLSSPSSSRFSSLSKLELSYTNIDLAIFSDNRIISVLQHTLTHLCIDGCANVDSNSFFYLKHLTSLIFLDISHCAQVDDNGLEVIAHIFPRIEQLNLSYLFRLTDKGISKLFKLPYLVHVNLLGCYRIRSYPWAMNLDRRKCGTSPIKELMLGEDSRIQTGGFWLLWCCWNWSMPTLVRLCPFLEVLRVNMVLFDLPPDSLTILLTGCKNLKHLGLVLDRATVGAMCENVVSLNALNSLELTCHIGITCDQMTSLIKSNCLKKLKTLKFHSKQTYVFTNSNLIDLSLKVSPAVEYLEINAEHLDDSALQSLIKLGSATTTSAIIGSKNEINSIDNNGNQLQNDSHINLAAMRIKIPNNNVTTSSSTSSPSTALNREFVSSPQNTTPTTAIREYPSKKISPISTSVKTPPKVLQNLLMHNATLSNETLDLFSSGLSNIRELTLTNLHQSSYSNRIARLVTGGKKSISIAKTCIPKQIAPTSDFTEICKKLRKIELSSMDGFTDKDLAIIPANCRELQWIEFSFRFTYPETIKAIADSCDQLLYLKLHRFNRITTSLHRPGIGGMVSAILNATAVGRGDRAVRGANAANRAAAVATAIINEAVGVANGEETHSDDEVDAAPTTATAATSSSSSPKSNHQEFLASSPECKALIYFGKKGPKTLRMLDICGNIGLTDWTLSQMKCCGSSLHTFFVEGNPNLSSTGLIRFAEHRWKFLKRINARNCPKVSFNVVQENYLSKGLEIEVTVDGGKRV